VNKIFSAQLFLALIAPLFYLYSNFCIASSVYINNALISYTDVGQGKPLILIHAFPTDKNLWTPQQEGLKEKFRVISLDLLGFGDSVPVDGNAVSIDDYADEVKQLLDYLHIEKAIIGGESMGGYVALAFLQQYPDRAEGLILSNTQAIADSPEAQTAREKKAIEVLENGTDNLIKGFMEKALTPNASDKSRSLLTQILTLQKPTALASALRGMAKRNQTSELLAHTALPILIITSDQDLIISSQQSEAMHALAKNSRLIVISNAGHLSNLEQPEQWNQAITDMF
jgi:pimeloyl-ACP methyl ester carboxylesterase